MFESLVNHGNKVIKNLEEDIGSPDKNNSTKKLFSVAASHSSRVLCFDPELCSESCMFSRVSSVLSGFLTLPKNILSPSINYPKV